MSRIFSENISAKFTFYIPFSYSSSETSHKYAEIRKMARMDLWI